MQFHHTNAHFTGHDLAVRSHTFSQPLEVVGIASRDNVSVELCGLAQANGDPRSRIKGLRSRDHNGVGLGCRATVLVLDDHTDGAVFVGLKREMRESALQTLATEGKAVDNAVLGDVFLRDVDGQRLIGAQRRRSPVKLGQDVAGRQRKERHVHFVEGVTRALADGKLIGVGSWCSHLNGAVSIDPFSNPNTVVCRLQQQRGQPARFCGRGGDFRFGHGHDLGRGKPLAQTTIGRHVAVHEVKQPLFLCYEQAVFEDHVSTPNTKGRQSAEQQVFSSIRTKLQGVGKGNRDGRGQGNDLLCLPRASLGVRDQGRDGAALGVEHGAAGSLASFGALHVGVGGPLHGP